MSCAGYWFNRIKQVPCFNCEYSLDSGMLIKDIGYRCYSQIWNCYSYGKLIEGDEKSISLSWCFKSDRRGSNPRSRPWQGRALPTTPLSHLWCQLSDYLSDKIYDTICSGVCQMFFYLFWNFLWWFYWKIMTPWKVLKLALFREQYLHIKFFH